MALPLPKTQPPPDPRPGYYTNLIYASQGRATAWKVESAHKGAGLDLRTTGGTLLCRVSSGYVYFWDKYQRAEIQISVEHLVSMALASK